MPLPGLLLAAALRVRVLDPSGAAVPKAAVTLPCAEARAQKAVTGTSGEAAFSVVDPAACALFVEARGFEPLSEPEVAPDASGLVAVRLVLARREEIEIMKLVGATAGFIRGPFMLAAAAQGLAGGGLAVAGLLATHRLVERAEIFRANPFLTIVAGRV